ncbi:9565_t:CDS:1, partial [Scutellospora calospora]
PCKNYFIWGKLSYETENNDIIYPDQTSIKGVQGLNGSKNGIQGGFIFDVVDQNNNIEIAKIKLNFDVP